MRLYSRMDIYLDLGSREKQTGRDLSSQIQYFDNGSFRSAATVKEETRIEGTMVVSRVVK